jgi:hypothetical protein
MSYDDRYDLLSKSVIEMRTLCSKWPDMRSEMRLVDMFEEIMHKVHSKDPSYRAYLHIPTRRHTIQKDCEIFAFPTLSESECSLESGWLLKEEPVKSKSVWPTVKARRASAPHCKCDDTSKYNIAFSAGSISIVVRPYSPCATAAISFIETLLFRPTRFGCDDCAAPARTRRVSWDTTEYVWEFPRSRSDER